MLKRILASMALTSLVLCGVLLVYWWRSTHGHVDSFTMGRGTATETQFSTHDNRIAVKVTDNRAVVVTSHTEFHPFRELLGYLFIVPGLWVAVKIRNWLPRPPGREIRPGR